MNNIQNDRHFFTEQFNVQMGPHIAGNVWYSMNFRIITGNVPYRESISDHSMLLEHLKWKTMKLRKLHFGHRSPY